MARAGPLRLDVPQWTGLSPLDVACGSDHTVVAMQDGSVRDPSTLCQQPLPARVCIGCALLAHAMCGACHATQLYAWGLATRGRLGLKSFGYLDTAATDRPAPPDPGIVPPVTLGPAAQAGVAGGQEEGEDKQTDNVRDADGDGVARLRSTDVQEVPARVELPCITVLPRVHRRVTQVACGACHTAVVAHDRSCFTWCAPDHEWDMTPASRELTCLPGLARRVSRNAMLQGLQHIRAAWHRRLLGPL